MRFTHENGLQAVQDLGTIFKALPQHQRDEMHARFTNTLTFLGMAATIAPTQEAIDQGGVVPHMTERMVMHEEQHRQQCQGFLPGRDVTPSAGCVALSTDATQSSALATVPGASS